MTHVFYYLGGVATVALAAHLYVARVEADCAARLQVAACTTRIAFFPEVR